MEEIERERLELERVRLNFEMDRLGFDASHNFARDGIKTLVLINGAAVIALLTFLGHNTAATTDAKKLALAMILFGFGVVAGAVCSLLAYMFQTVEREGQEWVRTRWLLRRAAISAAIIGLALFVAGLLFAACAFTSP